MSSSEGEEIINKTAVGENELSSMMTTTTIGETNARSCSAAKIDNTTSYQPQQQQPQPTQQIPAYPRASSNPIPQQLSFSSAAGSSVVGGISADNTTISGGGVNNNTSNTCSGGSELNKRHYNFIIISNTR